MSNCINRPHTPRTVPWNSALYLICVLKNKTKQYPSLALYSKIVAMAQNLKNFWNILLPIDLYFMAPKLLFVCLTIHPCMPQKQPSMSSMLSCSFPISAVKKSVQIPGPASSPCISIL